MKQIQTRQINLVLIIIVIFWSVILLTGLFIKQRQDILINLPETGVSISNKSILLTFTYGLEAKEGKISNVEAILIPTAARSLPAYRTGLLSVELADKNDNVVFREWANAALFFSDEFTADHKFKSAQVDPQTSFDLSLELPILDGTQRLSIYDNNENLLYESRTILKDIIENQELSVDHSFFTLGSKSEYSTSTNGKINIGVFGTDYDSENTFVKEANDFINNILSHEPYKTRKDQFNFVIVQNMSNKPFFMEECKDWYYNCFKNTEYSDIAIKQNFQKVYFLNKKYPKNAGNYDPYRLTGSWNHQSGYAQSDSYLQLHEFTHLFGLLDEYESEQEPYLPADPYYPGDEYEWALSFAPMPVYNCSLVKNNSDWFGIVADDDYLLGCNHRHLTYRSADRTLMREYTMWMSKLQLIILNDSLDWFVGPATTKGENIKISLNSPQNGAKINASDEITIKTDKAESLVALDYRVDGKLVHTNIVGGNINETAVYLPAQTYPISKYNNWKVIELVGYNGVLTPTNMIRIENNNGYYSVSENNTFTPPTPTPTVNGCEKPGEYWCSNVRITVRMTLGTYPISSCLELCNQNASHTYNMCRFNSLTNYCQLLETFGNCKWKPSQYNFHDYCVSGSGITSTPIDPNPSNTPTVAPTISPTASTTTVTPTITPQPTLAPESGAKLSINTKLQYTKNRSGDLQLLFGVANSANLGKLNGKSDQNGLAEVQTNISAPDSYILYIKPNHFLSQTATKQISIDTNTLTFNDDFLTGDLNNDDIVNGIDYSILSNNYNKPGIGDLNGDGLVNGFDHSILRKNYNSSGQYLLSKKIGWIW